ncbi:M28 family peptidase [Sporosarcina sp. P1]|uniref:M28 family peptidase n=1 Tax=Sporosarcina sp. P1 TaxID=2048257 RepID=UPI0018EB45D3
MKIVGKDSDSYILLSGHVDSYFAGFQDDNVAIGPLLGIAKGMIGSGYQPEKTIIFNAIAAEE